MKEGLCIVKNLSLISNFWIRHCFIVVIMLNSDLCCSQPLLYNDTLSTVKYEGGGASIGLTPNGKYILQTFNRGFDYNGERTGFLILDNDANKISFSNYGIPGQNIQGGSYGRSLYKDIEGGATYFYSAGGRQGAGPYTQAWVIKINDVGDSIFSVSIRNDTFDITARCVVPIDNSSLIVLSQCANIPNLPPNNRNDMYMARISKIDGAILWQKRVVTPNLGENPWCAIPLDSGRIAVCGYSSTSTIDKTAFWIVDTTGNILSKWTNSNGGLFSLKLTKDNNITTVGILPYSTNAAGKSISHPGVLKFNKAGALLWQKKLKIYNDTLFSGVIGFDELDNGDLILCGDADTVENGTGARWGAGLIVKTNANAIPKWYKFYDKKSILSNYHVGFINDIISLGDTGFAAIGWFSASPQKIWFLKLDSLGCDYSICSPPVYVGIKKNPELSPYLFPNPTTNSITIKYPGNTDLYKVLVYDLSGRIISDKQSSSTEEFFDISNLNSGMYMIKIQKNNEIIFSSKLIKQ